MIEQQPIHIELKEIEQPKTCQITIIGPACSGKTTLLNSMREAGYSVTTEPDNPLMLRFIEDPSRYAFQNQVYKSAQLMEQEIASSSEPLTNPSFRESGLLATAIYNRYLRDLELISEPQFNALDAVYQLNMELLPKPDLVVFLHADDGTIKNRAIKRDGVVAHDPGELKPYWEELLQDLEERDISIFRINTGSFNVTKTKEMILDAFNRLKENKTVIEPIESESRRAGHIPQCNFEYESNPVN